MMKRTNLFGVVLLGLLIAMSGLAATFQTGDVFASVSNGSVNWYRANGTFVQTLNTGLGGYTTGSVHDSAGNLYVTDFSAAAVSKFDTTGTLVGTFGTGYNSSPESILFDAAGNAYVGQADGTGDILKFSSAGGAPLANYNVATENRGSDWIDLAADQKTMYYTSEGATIKRFDVSTNTQLANFGGALPGSDAFALRLLSDGGLIVADSDMIRRLNSSGTVIQSYDVAGQDSWFALNLDPNGTSFWSGDSSSGNLYRFNIATGTLEQTINTGAGGLLFGVSVFGEITQSHPTVPEPSEFGVLLVFSGLLLWWNSRRKKSGANA